LIRPGLEPGPPRWEASDKPLELWRGLSLEIRTENLPNTSLKRYYRSEIPKLIVLEPPVAREKKIEDAYSVFKVNVISAHNNGWMRVEAIFIYAQINMSFAWEYLFVSFFHF
jgi:hypothetical protein